MNTALENVFAFIDGNNKTANTFLFRILRFASVHGSSLCIAWVHEKWVVCYKWYKICYEVIWFMFCDYFISELPYAYSILARMVIASSIEHSATGYFIYHWIRNKKEEDEKKKHWKWRYKRKSQRRWAVNFAYLPFLPLYISVGFLLRWHIMDSLVNAFHVPLIHIHIHLKY